MVEFFGTLSRSTVQNGQRVNEFRIPAFSSRAARGRARANARIKGLDDFELRDPEEVDQGDVPGQSIYLVEVRSVA